MGFEAKKQRRKSSEWKADRFDQRVRQHGVRDRETLRQRQRVESLCREVAAVGFWLTSTNFLVNDRQLFY